jgi:rhodanese-related sulfurtransferase
MLRWIKKLIREKPKMNIQQKNIDEVYALYNKKPKDYVFIDVRQPEEWADGTIPGITRIMLSELPQHLETLDKHKTYVMVCRSGARSGRACEAMAQAGFTQTLNFSGGMLSWYERQYPLEK